MCSGGMRKANKDHQQETSTFQCSQVNSSRDAFKSTTRSSLSQDCVALGHHTLLSVKWSFGEPRYQDQMCPICCEVHSWFLALYLDIAGNGGKTQEWHTLEKGVRVKDGEKRLWRVSSWNPSNHPRT